MGQRTKKGQSHCSFGFGGQAGERKGKEEKRARDREREREKKTAPDENLSLSLFCLFSLKTSTS